MSQPFVGEIRMCPYNFAPYGWASCDGSVLAIAEYDVLFTLIGTTYGGDGVSTFNLPDLRGRIPVHQAPGYFIGQAAGTEEVTLISNQLPVHTHSVGAIAANGTDASPSAKAWATSNLGTFSTSTTPTLAAMAPGIVSSVGSSQPHDNRMPYLTVHFIIALWGIYPSPT